MSEDQYVVSFGRWDATQRENERRLARLEQVSEKLAGNETVHQALSARVTALEGFHHADAAGEQSRRDRTWAMGLVLIGSLILPVLTTAIITFLHLHSYH